MKAEAKIEWLKNATNEEVVKQYTEALRLHEINKGLNDLYLEDVEIAKAELLKRMEK